MKNYICKMELNDALIEKIARLARLRFDESERPAIRNDLQKMIGFVEKLNELNLDDVQPLLHMSEELNVLRDDIVEGSVSRKEALQNAPLHDGQFFKAPKVIKNQQK